jgi:peptidyl-prolyl cis-trans isomerase B (cyclophilin B)
MRALSAIAVVLALQAKPAAPFTSPFTLDQMKGKQAVVETTMGTFVIQLLPEAAPNHVAHFMKLAGDGAYARTIFHRVIKYGIIQGGDPLSKDPARAAQYGTGGLNVLEAEINKEPMTAGAVAAVLVPNRPDSAGAQFFVCVIDQPPLEGQYTIFGRVVEGIEVVQNISAVDADSEGRPKGRVEIVGVTIRDTPPPVRDPIAEGTPAELAAYRVVLETTLGAITLEPLADKAPETVRQFLTLVRAGVYDGVGVHRVSPNFVIQTGALSHRAPLSPSQQKLVRSLAPEFNDTATVPGVVSMARGDDPASATTSFFICTGECRSLDAKYTAFARVVAGMEVVKAIAAVAVDGEAPKEAVTVLRARLHVQSRSAVSGSTLAARRAGP